MSTRSLIFAILCGTFDYAIALQSGATLGILRKGAALRSHEFLTIGKQTKRPDYTSPKYVNSDIEAVYHVNDEMESRFHRDHIGMTQVRELAPMARRIFHLVARPH